MFKTRFKRWGWFKNISRKNPSRARVAAAATSASTCAAEADESSLVTRGHRRGRLMTHMNPAASASVAPRWLNLPDHLAFQELPLVTSRAYVRSQFEGQGWVAEELGTKQVRPDHDRFDFTESETTILWTLHLMKIGCVRKAYETIHAFCEMLKKGVTTLHPLMLYEFWLLWRKAYDICVMGKCVRLCSLPVGEATNSVQLAINSPRRQFQPTPDSHHVPVRSDGEQLPGHDGVVAPGVADPALQPVLPRGRVQRRRGDACAQQRHAGQRAHPRGDARP